MTWLDDAVKKRVGEILEHASKIENYYFVGKTALPSELAEHCFAVQLDHDYKIVFSRTATAQGSVFRHLSVINTECGCAPQVPVVAPLLEAFGFVSRDKFHVEVQERGHTTTAVQRLLPEEA